MTTQLLIDDLVTDLVAVRPARIARLLGLAALVLAAQALLIWALGEMRADLVAGSPSAVLVWRALASLAIAGTCAALALRLRVPTHTPDLWPAAVLAVALVAVAAGWVLDLAQPSPLPAALRMRPLAGLHCIAVVFASGLPMLVLLVFLLRRGATVRPETAAASAGLAAAAAGGFVWSLSCQIDDPAYAALWYLLAFALMTGLARLALPGVVKLRPRCDAREAMRRQLIGR